MYLFLKIDTSGLLRSELPLSDRQQPWAVRIAFDHTDTEGNTLNRLDMMVKADGRSIKPGALEIHGITIRQSEQNGVQENALLILLSTVTGLSQVAVTYSEFDNKIIDSLLLRLAAKLGKPEQAYLGRWRRPGLSFLTMQDPVAKSECELPHEERDGEFRSPKLDEACELLLNEPLPTRPLSAFDNLQRTKRLFFHLKDLGHFNEVLTK